MTTEAVIVVTTPHLRWVAEGPMPVEAAVARARAHWVQRSLFVRSLGRRSPANVRVHLLGPEVITDP
jgi:hypothetical protein